MRELKIDFLKTGQNLEYPENLGKRSKLGGEPDWIQNDETPICPNCGSKMEFICQIDSIDYGKKKDEKEYMFGDVGMLYNFFCFSCEEAKTIFQEY
jgi:uncharacterized protein YwqG